MARCPGGFLIVLRRQLRRLRPELRSQQEPSLPRFLGQRHPRRSRFLQRPPLKILQIEFHEPVPACDSPVTLRKRRFPAAGQHFVTDCRDAATKRCRNLNKAGADAAP